MSSKKIFRLKYPNKQSPHYRWQSNNINPHFPNTVKKNEATSFSR